MKRAIVLGLSARSVAVLAAVVGAATALSIVSFQYSIQSAARIHAIAADDVRSNSEIQAHDLGNGLRNKIGSVSSALDVLRASSSVQSYNVSQAAPQFAQAKTATGGFASSFFWVDKDGKLVWADAFANSTIADLYAGDDRSFRAYYSTPRDTLEPYYSTVIESVDSVPRLYISYPILSSANGTAASVGDFNGVVAASIDLDVLGAFLERQLSPKYQATTGMIDPNGIILYSRNTTLIGKDVFGPEFQAILPQGIKESFNSILRESLQGEPGSADITFQGNTSTLAYQPVNIDDNEFAVLYVVAPHQLSSNVGSLIAQQSIINIVILGTIAGVTVAIVVLTLVWNSRLSNVVRDRTIQLKSANEELTAANEQLKSNDKMQREFINIAAHELRTPTQAVMGYAELLRIHPEDLNESIDAIARNASRLARLTEDILDVSRIEAGTLELSREKFNLSEVISAAISDARAKLSNGDLRIVYQDPKDIIIEADRDRITQVISNLINNAIKATKKGMISVLAEENPEFVRVSVIDTGTGIHPDIELRLFSKFASKSQTGTGLGLYIAKNITEAHGGTISGKNNVGTGGAIFSFTLPRKIHA